MHLNSRQTTHLSYLSNQSQPGRNSSKTISLSPETSQLRVATTFVPTSCGVETNDIASDKHVVNINAKRNNISVIKYKNEFTSLETRLNAHALESRNMNIVKHICKL